MCIPIFTIIGLLLATKTHGRQPASKLVIHAPMGAEVIFKRLAPAIQGESTQPNVVACGISGGVGIYFIGCYYQGDVDVVRDKPVSGFSMPSTGSTKPVVSFTRLPSKSLGTIWNPGYASAGVSCLSLPQCRVYLIPGKPNAAITVLYSGSAPIDIPWNHDKPYYISSRNGITATKITTRGLTQK